MNKYKSIEDLKKEHKENYEKFMYDTNIQMVSLLEKYEDLTQTLENERDTYKRLSESNISKYNALLDKYNKLNELYEKMYNNNCKARNFLEKKQLEKEFWDTDFFYCISILEGKTFDETLKVGIEHES